MSRNSGNMLRTRRRDNNVKPNRRDSRPTRLDRKSSRGMIYENEELRLKTININAEIERGQYDIKKLKRENELLKKEIWCLRDEYDKLDKLLKEKEMDFSSSSTTCTSDSESCSSCSSEESDDQQDESTQNLENVQKTNMKNLHVEFDHLSVVPEENSENSDGNRTSLPNGDHKWGDENPDRDVIQPDQSYPAEYGKANTLPRSSPPPKFAPIKISKSFEDNAGYYTTEKLVETNATNFYQNMVLVPPPDAPAVETDFEKLDKALDVVVKTDNRNFDEQPASPKFLNGGNLEELLNDIETISQDILKMSGEEKPYKSELNVVLMPKPMPLLGFEKFSKSLEDLKESLEFQQEKNDSLTPEIRIQNSKSNLLAEAMTSSELVSSENEENLKFQTSSKDSSNKKEKSPSEKLSMRRKVSIHFKGRSKDGGRNSIFSKFQHKKTPSLELKEPAQSSGESKTTQSSSEKTKDAKAKQNSTSPERKRAQHDKKHRKHKRAKSRANLVESRRGTITSIDRLHRERSFSNCTDRSLRLNGYDSESLSSCDSFKTTRRKMSNISIPLNGKVPWCACWGNGCL